MELSRSPTQEKIYLLSLGCAKNLVDSEVIQGMLMTSGYQMTRNKEAAEVIIINTCAFIEAATREAIAIILDLSEQKKTGACRYLVVCGCLPQRYKDTLAQELPEVDLFLGTGEFQHITKHLKNLKRGQNTSKMFALKPTFLLGAGTPRILATPAYTAYLKIAEGCSHRCTYCIIPKIRGPYKSRSPRSILAEARKLAAGGVKEINLIAQDTTWYGRDTSHRADIARVLKQLVGIPELHWIRLLYCHPYSLSRELIDLVAQEEKICSYIDLPLQHISDPVLKRMGRKMNRKQLEQLLYRLRDRAPQIAVRTTLMVGFPGETGKDFDDLISFISGFEFDHLGVFRYRDEEGAAAFRLQPKVPEKIKQERYHMLMSLQAKISRKRNRARAGQELEVLVAGPAQSAGYELQCRAEFQAPEVDGVVYLKNGTAAPGTFTKVRIIKGLTYDLVGEFIG